MATTVTVRDLRQNLSKFIARLERGEDFVVTKRGREVGRLTPAGESDDDRYFRERWGAEPPTRSMAEVLAEWPRGNPAPEGTVDAWIEWSRRDAWE